MFTFILEYCGGTYLWQHTAAGIDEAFDAWLVGFRDWLAVYHNDIEGMSEDEYEELLCDAKGERAVPVEGLRDVWCFAMLVKRNILRFSMS